MNKQQNEGDKEDRYYWNCCLEGDEFCQEALKKYNKNENVKPGELADRMTQEGMKVQLKQMYEEMTRDFEVLKPRIEGVIEDFKIQINKLEL